MQPYGVHSRDYLRRARRRLDERSNEALFYAAFELRCGIEARMHQYLEARTNIAKRKKRGWKIARLAKNLETAFRTGDKVVEFAVLRNGQKEATAFYYTPVTSRLRRMAERLGDFMHAMQRDPPSDEWWTGTRTTLEAVFEELYKASAGTLLGPPLVNAQGKLEFVHEPLPGEDPSATMALLGRSGEEITIQVRYLDDLPKDHD